MGVKRISIDGHVLQNGVRLASSCTDTPLLCIIKGDTVTTVASSRSRLVVSWRSRLADKVAQSMVFLIPPVVASFMRADALQTVVEITQEDDTITLATFDELGRCEVKWSSELSQFPAPPELGQMLTTPPYLAEASYLTVSDAVHNAVARLVELESEQHIHKDKLAILVNFSHSQLSINGREIQSGPKAEYYFDPRLIIRALEFIKSDTVKIGVTPLGTDRNRAFLSVVSVQDDLQVHCALLSIGVDTQKLYPLHPDDDH